VYSLISTVIVFNAPKLLYGQEELEFLAKIAIDLERAVARRAAKGGTCHPRARPLAQGSGWAAHDVICTSGPQDRPYEEQHSDAAIAIVAAGTFQYRSDARSGARRELMTPGSLLLGNAGQVFECAHDHGTGDRCLSFHYSPDYLEQLAADAGVPAAARRFHHLRVPPLRPLSPLIACGCAALTGALNTSWEEFSIELAGRTLQLASGLCPDSRSIPPGAEARVTRIVRMIESHSTAELTLENMALLARLNPYHFLRTFQLLTGVTPHRYLLRHRLRNVAIRLAASKTASILDVALDSGFGDVSNFNRAFRTEFGVSPRVYRKLRS
jgi:AraC-like DNA-binding protein